MNGIKNLFQFLYDNWTTILVCLGLIAGIVKKTKDYLSKSDEEKVELAKAQLSEVILKMISDAEIEWQEWSSAGAIKRSQVIQRIYEEYPILAKVVEQDDLIEWIDELIDNALETLREIVKENTEVVAEETAGTTVEAIDATEEITIE